MDAEALRALELPAILERLAARAATDLGAGRARALAPSPDPDEVRARQALTAEAVALLDAAEEPALGGIVDIAPAAERAGRDGLLGPAELRAIARTVAVAVEARAALGRTSSVLLAELAEPIDPTLATLAAELDRCVEEDGSDLRDTASPLLRRLRT
ncbi:MAG TPA: hypothetical protein VHC01_06245, partial [Gaiellaceae bacterium]|nr:hypothetical protein [Gaiellaceae bacterium]